MRLKASFNQLKKFAAPALHSLAFATGLSAARARAIHTGRILCLHGVSDDFLPATAFEAQLAWLTKHFSIVSLGTLLDRLATGKLTNEIALTFDDGLRNNFTAAFPLLKKFNAPATFFVCPGLVESQRWLWNQEARARLQVLSDTEREQLASQWRAGAGGDIEQIVAWMKTLPVDQRRDRERDLRELTSQFQATAEQRSKSDIMNRDELRSLDPGLITIGSHTVSHPILTTLSPNQLRFEIGESRRNLEDKLGRKVEYFCYPNGVFNPAVVEQTRKVYKAAVAGSPGFVTPGTDCHCLPRIGGPDSLPLLAWRMHRPTA